MTVAYLAWPDPIRLLDVTTPHPTPNLVLFIVLFVPLAIYPAIYILSN
jgi:hypothetical protein